MVTLTETAVRKVLEILATQDPKPIGLRVAVVGGGCSGFQYRLAFETTQGPLDKVYAFTSGTDELKVFVDQASLLYLDGVAIDYIETLEEHGFKFSNPNVTHTCGCGSSFEI